MLYLIIFMKNLDNSPHQIKGSRSKQGSATINVEDNIYEIFAYKKAYDVHVRKLSQIRNMRKQSLNANLIRNVQIESIKDIKHNNFVYKINQQAYKICGDNLKLFERLQRQKNISKTTPLKMPISMKTKRSLEMASSFVKSEKQKILAKQNKRLKQRIKSSESWISSSRLLQDQKKRQQIRSRIRKFNGQSELKAHRYFSALQSREYKTTTLSCNLSKTNERRKSCSEVEGFPDTIGDQKQKERRKLVSFYNPRDVIGNKIQNFQPRGSTKNTIGNRNQKKFSQRKYYNSFFATQ